MQVTRNSIVSNDRGEKAVLANDVWASIQKIMLILILRAPLDVESLSLEASPIAATVVRSPFPALPA